MVQNTIDWFVEPNKVSGWVYDDGKPVQVNIEKNGNIIGSGENNLPRSDLESAGLGSCAFTLETSEPFSYYDIISGYIKVYYKKNGEKIEILIRDDTIKTIKFKIFTKLLDDFKNINPNELEMYIYNERKCIGEDIYYAGIASFSALNNNKVPMKENADIRQKISPFYIKIGTVSPDLQSEVGADGHLFLTRGSNDVLSIYEKNYNSQEVEENSESWIKLLRERLNVCDKIGAKFIEVIIPDKLSVLKEKYDGTGSAVSPFLQRIEYKINKNNLSDYYVSGLQSIEKIGFSEAFRKIDTHFHPRAGHVLFQDICRKISPFYNVPAQFDVDYITTGDIGKRFFGQELYEICSRAPHPTFHAGREVIEHIPPQPGKFTGGRAIFRNNLAPFPEKVVGFGNSFMNNYESQSSLGYWFSTFFQEFHLITHPCVDHDYLEKVRPDIVIGQTVERFLRSVPNS